jgi:glycosyltransferase involved in cell wall biosynthesis
MHQGDASNSGKPRVLFVGVDAPWKGGAGYLARQEMFLRALAECAILDLAMVDLKETTGAPPYASNVIALPMPSERRASMWIGSIGELLSPLPMNLHRADVSRTREALRQLPLDDYDAVFAYRFDFAYFTGVLDHPRLILDIDDPEHIRRRARFRMLGNGRMDWWTALDLAKLRRFERKAARRAMASFVCQDQDQKAFSKPGPMIVPNCVEVPPACPERHVAAPTVLFVGNLTGGPDSPNRDAADWFLGAVWPRVIDRVPDCQFQVVGAMSDSLRTQLESRRQVQPTGFLQDLAGAYAAASLSVAPIRYGTGTRVKILESMAWGCPVVSTPKGCEGIAATPGRDILIGATPQEFAEHCIGLLADPARQQAMSQAAFRLVAANYDRTHVHRELVEKLRRIIHEGTHRAARTPVLAMQAG